VSIIEFSSRIYLHLSRSRVWHKLEHTEFNCTSLRQKGGTTPYEQLWVSSKSCLVYCSLPLITCNRPISYTHTDTHSKWWGKRNVGNVEVIEEEMHLMAESVVCVCVYLLGHTRLESPDRVAHLSSPAYGNRHTHTHRDRYGICG